MPAVHIRDISPRLAFQARLVDTAVKVELVDRLTAAGMKTIEISSFVNPKLVPGLADATTVFSRVRRAPGISLECCVANLTGIRRAIDAGAHAAWFLLAVDEDFSRLNTGRSIDESLAELERMRAAAEGSGMRFGTYLIHAFGGPAGLPRGPADIRPLMERLISLDVRDWVIADSNGYAGPDQVRATVGLAGALVGVERLRVQVHDTRGMGLANIAELGRMGVAGLDTALAGSGGHPAAPDALVGGTCTEDAVQLLELMGIDTGLDLSALIEAANWLDGVLGGTGLGFVRRSGKVPSDHREVRGDVEIAAAWQRT